MNIRKITARRATFWHFQFDNLVWLSRSVDKFDFVSIDSIVYILKKRWFENCLNVICAEKISSRKNQTCYDIWNCMDRLSSVTNVCNAENHFKINTTINDIGAISTFRFQLNQKTPKLFSSKQKVSKKTELELFFNFEAVPKNLPFKHKFTTVITISILFTIKSKIVFCRLSTCLFIKLVCFICFGSSEFHCI